MRFLLSLPFSTSCACDEDALKLHTSHHVHQCSLTNPEHSKYCAKYWRKAYAQVLRILVCDMAYLLGVFLDLLAPHNAP